MKAVLVLLLAVTLFTGCATHSPEEIAAVRAAGVSNRTVAKLEHEEILSPEDLIELRRRGVSDSIAIRHLDDVGVDYVVQRNDLRQLRQAGVRPTVVQELVRQSNDFYEDVYDHSRWSVGVSAGYYPGYYRYGWPYYHY
jgi:hypothetical protein